MSSKRYSLSKKLVAATVLALGAFGLAMADGFNADNSMSRLGGDGYAYFNQPAASNTAASATWRRSKPDGLSERDLQALSSSSLAASASQLDNPSPVFASVPTDPSWRQSHPNGLTEHEMQAAGSSGLAMWQVPIDSGATIVQRNVAKSPSKQTSLAGAVTSAGTNPNSWTFGE